jgi:hypothetical protein
VVRVHNALITTSPEDAKLFSAVITDQRAERALMDATFGDPNVVDDDNVLELLNRVKRATVEEVTTEKNVEISRVEAERDAATFALHKQQIELQRLRNEVKLAEENSLNQARKDLEEKRDKVRSSFVYACVVYKWSGVMVGLFLTMVAYFMQISLSGILRNSAPGSIWASVARAWWIPILTFIVPTALTMYEMPEIVFGSLRVKMANFVLNRLLWWHRVRDVGDTARCNYKIKSIQFCDSAVTTAELRGSLPEVRNVKDTNLNES